MTPLRTSSAILAALAVLQLAARPSSAGDKEKLFVATPLTAEKQRLVHFRVDRPGLAWQRLAQKEAGFKPLFNGKDFTGWRFSGGPHDGAREAPNWKVEGGVIRLAGGSQPHLATAQEYADFELRLGLTCTGGKRPGASRSGGRVVISPV